MIPPIRGYYPIPHLRRIFAPEEFTGSGSNSYQTQESALGAGRTHYVPPGDVNQTHPKTILVSSLILNKQRDYDDYISANVSILTPTYLLTKLLIYHKITTTNQKRATLLIILT